MISSERNSRAGSAIMQQNPIMPLLRVGCCALMALASGMITSRAAEPISFEGKTVTMMIGSAAGGGTDASGRLIARFLGKYLPGNPTVIVKNVPGAQGMTSMNYFANQVAP